MAQLNEYDVLHYNPFEGDFGSPSDRRLKDKIVTARAAAKSCHCCSGPINPGERSRVWVDIFDGKLMEFRWCFDCCEAMAAWWKDDGAAMVVREELGKKRRASECA
ncbi:hypothetical protein ACJJIE_00175 (plasmid) [Microbulbifer sp. TRSA001]|uniref:hypothetical protein n=1 Tax=Microbulbifer sp. TRSA001 TaxID=3243381 RepID=UPI0040390D45